METLVTDDRIKTLKKYSGLAEVLRERNNEHGISIIRDMDVEEYIGYKSLYENASRILSYLQKQGLKHGDKVILQLSDSKQFMQGFWACQLGGYVAAPLIVGNNSQQRTMLFQVRKKLKNAYIFTTEVNADLLMETCKTENYGDIEQLGEAFLFMEEAEQSTFSGEIYQSSIEDISYIQFSSGSTGEPKGILLSHGNLLANMRDIAKRGEYTSRMNTLCWLPLTHNFGMIGFHLTSIFSNMNQYVIPTNVFLANPMIWMMKCNEKRINYTYSPTFGFRLFMQAYRESKEYAEWDLSCIKMIYNGAEPVSIDLCVAFVNALKDKKLAGNVIKPAYGLAEAAVAVTIPKVKDRMTVYYADRYHLGAGDNVKELTANDKNALAFAWLGQPVDSTVVRICDGKGCELLEGQIGYIELRGESITNGYYNDEKETNKLFTGDGWLKTGDLGFLVDRNLIITGRGKEVIFINGKNFYPNDIEKTAYRLNNVPEGSVLACGNYNTESEMDEVVLFVINESPFSEFKLIGETIRKHISEQLGITVSRIVPVKEFIRTYSGKVQRFRMIEQYRNGVYDEDLKSYESITLVREHGRNEREAAPLTPLEKKIVNMWEEILEVKNISIHDSFFDLGGQSVKLAMFVARINKEMNTNINAGMVFKYKTIANLEEHMEYMDDRREKSIKKLERADFYSVSSAQKRMYLVQNIKQGETVYNIPVIIEVPGKIDRDRIKKSFIKVIQCHEALRTYFNNSDGEIVQCVNEIVEPEIEEKVISKCKDAVKIIGKAVKKFQLSKAPLIRMTIFHQSDQKEFILLDMHHIISDGSSVGIIVRDLIASYEGRLIEPEKVNYKDFAAWQNQYLKSEMMKEQKEYWLNRFADEIPILNLPTDYHRPGEQEMSGRRIEFLLTKERYEGIKRIIAQTDATLYMVLLAMYNVLLYKLSGQNDIVIGSPIVGRSHPDLKETVGMFVNTLAMRNHLKESMTFTEFLKTVKNNTIDGMNHSDFQLEELVDLLEVTRDMGRNPLFDVMFTLQNMNLPKLQLDDMKIKAFEGDSGVAKYDLTLYATEEIDGIRFEFEYANSLFCEESIRNFIYGFYKVVDNVISDDKVELKDISILSEEEKNRFLYDINQTVTAYPKDKTLAQLFEEQVGKHRDEVAVIDGSIEMTYGQVNRYSNQLADYLREKGVNTNELVGIFVHRSLEMIIGILGILKAGAAYLPIDAAAPNQRIQDMTEDSKVRLILVGKGTEEAYSYISKATKTTSILLDLEGEIFKKYDINNPVCKNRSRDLAYVMYTSGSTGKPKGNPVKQYSVTRVVKNTNYIEITENDSILQLSNYAFDGSVFDIFGALLNGAKLVLVKHDVLIDILKLTNLIYTRKITVFFVTTALFNTIVDVDVNCLKGVRKILFGGERASRKYVEKAFHCIGKGRITNVYGPTENTVFTTYYPIDNLNEDMTNIPIGKPISNSRLYVMNSCQNIQPIGVAGELCIAGDGLIDGYLNRKELTDEKFVPNPYKPKEILYRSGDLVRWNRDGEIEFLDRMDNQVKIRGFRIELGEIENKLLENDGINEVVVLPIKEQNMNLAAYYTGEKEVNLKKIRNILAETLPPYMIPLYYIKLDALPLNVNGKINKAKLPAVDAGKNIDGEEETANEMENRIRDIWKKVLNMDGIGLHDNFFDLGGNSLLIMRLHSHIKELTRVDIKVTDLFINPTVYKMASFIVKRQEDVNKSIQLKATPLRSDYFVTEKWESIKDTVCVEMDDDVFEKIGTFNLQQRKELLLAGFVCLMYKFTRQSNIMLYMYESDEVAAAKINMSAMFEMDVLLEQIRGIFENSHSVKKYALKNISEMPEAKEEQQVRILWCGKKEESAYAHLHKQFQMIMNLQDFEGEIQLECDYDASILKEEKITEFLSLIFKMTGLLMEERGE